MARLNSFEPNWASFPGETISDVLREKNISIESFTKKMNCTTGYIQGLLSGQEKITTEIAARLADNLGSSVRFWMIRETQYREDVQRLALKKKEQEEIEWLRGLPLKDMAAFGWLKLPG